MIKIYATVKKYILISYYLHFFLTSRNNIKILTLNIV